MATANPAVATTTATLNEPTIDLVQNNASALLASAPSLLPSMAPSGIDPDDIHALEIAEEEHNMDAITTLLLIFTLIACLLAAYYVKRRRIYYLPESAISLLVGVFVGGVARLSTDNLQLFEFVSF